MASNSMLRGSAGLEWNHVVWFHQSHNLVHRKQDGSDHTMWYMSATSIGPLGMVQPIAVAMT